MSRKNKSIDLAFKKVQEPLVEGLSALAILSDCLVKDVQSSKTTNTPWNFKPSYGRNCHTWECQLEAKHEKARDY